MRQALKMFTKLVFTLFFRVEVINREKIPAAGPAILCSNHNSMLDMFFLGYRLKRWVFWMAKEELFKNPASALFFRLLGAFPVKRGKADVGSIKAAYKLLDEDSIVGIFPEGHRNKNRKQNSIRIKPGAALLAVNSGARVIPAAIEGDYRIFGRIRVVFGDPFEIKVENGKKYSVEDLTEISADIMKRVHSLLEASS